MARYYVSFSGKSANSREHLYENIDAVESAIRSLGHEAVSSLRRAEPEAIVGKPFNSFDKFGYLMEIEFAAIKASDALISVVQSPLVGTGQAMELSYAKGSGKPTILLSHESATVNILSPLADHKLIFQDSSKIGRLIIDYIGQR